MAIRNKKVKIETAENASFIVVKQQDGYFVLTALAGRYWSIGDWSMPNLA